mgnify:CR=1 FL=1
MKKSHPFVPWLILFFVSAPINRYVLVNYGFSSMVISQSAIVLIVGFIVMAWHWW